jgi:hypothetical protein
MKNVHPQRVFIPDRRNIRKFLIPPVLFSLLACFLVITFAGFDIGGIFASLIIAACVCLPFIVLILPTFYLEKIVIESFTATFYFVFIFMRFKKVIHIDKIIEIKEQYRNQASSGQREILIKTDDDTVLISEAKYTHDDIVELIYTLQNRNQNINVTLLK